ncbi:MAG: HEAT repeat domain-containing protein [Candidatus Thiodiazotropha endolucinida]
MDLFNNLEYLSDARLRFLLKKLPNHDGSLRSYFDLLDRDGTDHLDQLLDFKCIFDDLDQRAEKLVSQVRLSWKEGTVYHLKTSNLTKQLFALLVLKKQPNEQANQFVLEALDSNEPMIQLAAINALDVIDEGISRERLTQLYETVDNPVLKRRAGVVIGVEKEQTLAPSEDERIAEMGASLNDECSDTRLSAVLELAGSEAPQAVSLLRKALSDREKSVQINAFKSLLQRCELDEQELLQMLQDKRSHMRTLAIKALAAKKAEFAVPEIADELLKPFSHESRLAAARAILKLGGENVIPVVSEALRSLTEHHDVRIPLVNIMGRFKTEICLHELEYQLGLPLEDIEPAWQASSVWVACVRSISNYSQPEVDAVLERALEHTCDEVRIEAVNALKRRGAVSSIASLKRCLECEKSQQICDVIESALYELEKHSAEIADETSGDSILDSFLLLDPCVGSAPDVLEKLWNVLLGSNRQERYKAAQLANNSACRSETINRMIGELSKKPSRQRAYAIDVLALLGAVETSELILPIIDSDATYERKAAEKALLGFGYDKELLEKRLLESRVARAMESRKPQLLGSMKQEAIPLLRAALVDYQNEPGRCYEARHLLLNSLSWKPETPLEEVVCFASLDQRGRPWGTLEKSHLPFLLDYIAGSKDFSKTLLEEVARFDESDGRYLVSLFHSVPNVWSCLTLSNIAARYVPEILPLIEKSLQSDHPAEVMVAARTLMRCDGHKFEQALLDTLDRWMNRCESTELQQVSEKDVETALIAALGVAGSRKALTPLASLIHGARRSAVPAIEALTQIGGSEVVMLLRSALNSDSLAVQEACAKALYHLSWKPTSPREIALLAIAANDADQFQHSLMLDKENVLEVITAQPKRRYPKAIRDMVYLIDDPRVISILLDELSALDHDRSRAAVDALVKHGERVVSVLLRRYFPQNRIELTIDTYGIQELPRIFEPLKSKSTVEFLCAFLEGSGKYQTGPALKSAALGLGRKKDARAIPALMAALRFQWPQVRRAVLKALVQLKAVEAIEAIEQAPPTNSETTKLEARAQEVINKLKSLS